MTDPYRPEIPEIEDKATLDWGSDLAAEMLRRLDIEYISLNPGASFRGFHDSLVNYLGNRDPQILLCLHEDHAVAIAHGYAKATDKPMAVALHANVGLMHALLGIFNAWCDRAPIFVIGANGPANTALRRPWIDWIHTHKDPGALLRDCVKWDDEPRTAAALVESMLRANQLMRTPPRGPVYTCLDIGLQESRLDTPIEIPPLERFEPAQTPAAPRQVINEIADTLLVAERPLVLAGRGSRAQDAWDNRVRLAELCGARVATDLKSAAAFPTDHPLHLAGLTLRISDQVVAALRDADVVLLLDWIDAASLLHKVGDEISGTIINCSLDSYAHHGASMEHYGLAPADISVLAEPNSLVADLLAVLESRLGGRPKWCSPGTAETRSSDPQATKDADDSVAPGDIGLTLNDLRSKHKITLARVPIAWNGDLYPFRDPLDFLGYDGGGGLSSGPGNTIGAALGLRDSDRRVVGILGDGDFMQAASTLWTAARYAIPAVFVISNNRSNLTDVAHQKTIASQRSRPQQNSGIGQHIDEPAIDLAALAAAQGVEAAGPITRYGDLKPALEKALGVVAAGRPYLLDVWVDRV